MTDDQLREMAKEAKRAVLEAESYKVLKVLRQVRDQDQSALNEALDLLSAAPHLKSQTSWENWEEEVRKVLVKYGR